MHFELSPTACRVASLTCIIRPWCPCENSNAVDGCIRNTIFMQQTYQNQSPFEVYAAAERMLRFMEGCELDEPLTRWKAELDAANEKLMDRICDRSKKIGLKDQANALLKCIVSIRLLVKSCLATGDADLVEHAKAVERILNSYVGFRHMCIASKMTNSELILYKLTTPEMLLHVEAIPELSGRLSLLEQAREDVSKRREEMVESAVAAKNSPQLQSLKRNVAQLMNKIGDYLKAMSCVDAEAYGPMLRMFQLILSDQAKRRKVALRRKKQRMQKKQDASTVKMTKSVAEKKDEGLDAEMGEDMAK